MKKIYILLIISFSFFSCRKEIEEPPVNTRNQNFVFMEIDGEKFMVEDRTWNFNKNTIGSFDSQSIAVTFEADTVIRVSCQANNKNRNNQRKYKILKLGLSFSTLKKTGIATPYYFQLAARCYTNENKYFDIDIRKQPFSIPQENESFMNSIITINEYNEVNKTIELTVKGEVENIKNNRELVPVFVRIKLKNNR
jgi:hypothetical protein